MKSILLALTLTALALPLAAQETSDAKAKAPAKVTAAKNVTPDEAEKLIKETPGLIVLDVRSPEEFDHQHLKEAVNVNIRSGDFEAELAKLDQTKPVLVHCAAGNRSSEAVETLQKKTKFSQIYHLNSGISGWKKAGKPIEEKPLPKPDRALPGQPGGAPKAGK